MNSRRSSSHYYRIFNILYALLYKNISLAIQMRQYIYIIGSLIPFIFIFWTRKIVTPNVEGPPYRKEFDPYPAMNTELLKKYNNGYYDYHLKKLMKNITKKIIILIKFGSETDNVESQLSKDFHIIDEGNDSEILKSIENDKEIKNIIFEKVGRLENINKKLERYPDIYRFGIIIEKRNPENIYKMKIISTFKTINGPNDNNIGIQKIFRLKESFRFKDSGFIAIQSILEKSIIESDNYMSKINEYEILQPAPVEMDNLLVFRDSDRIYQIGFLFLSFGFLMLSLSQIYIITSEKQNNLDLQLYQLGVSPCMQGISWCISTYSLNIIFILGYCVLIFSKILIYTDYSLLLIYAISNYFAFFSFTLFSTALSTNFGKNFRIHMMIFLPSLLISFFKPYAPEEIERLLEIAFPLKNLSAFLMAAKEFEELEIRLSIDMINRRIIKNGIKIFNLIEYNIVSFVIYLILYFSLLYKRLNAIDFKNIFGKRKYLGKRKKNKNRSRYFSKNNTNDYEYGIEIKNLNKSYGRKKVLESLNMNVPKGKISILIGNNGAGKSTIMNCILGFTNFNSGEVKINCENSMTDEQFFTPISYDPQYDTIYPALTIQQHLEFFGKLKGLTNQCIKKNIKELENLIGQQGLSEKSVGSFSGGMKRKLTIFIAFLGNPSTIILDEPTSSIDPVARQEIWQLINKMQNEQKTIIICTHTPKEADLLGDYYFILSERKIQKKGTRKELIEETGIKPKLLIFISNDCIESEKILFIEKLKLIENIEIKKRDKTEIVLDLPQISSLNNENLHQLLNETNFIKSIIVKESSARDIFLNNLKDDNVLQENKKIDIDSKKQEIGCCRLALSQIISQFQKNWYSYTSLKFICYFHIVTLILVSLINGLLILETKNYFEIRLENYTSILHPETLVKNELNNICNFLIFHSIDNRSEYYDLIVNLLKDLDNKSPNPCLGISSIKEHEAFYYYNSYYEANEESIKSYSLWKKKDVLGAFMLNNDYTGFPSMKIFYSKNHYSIGPIMLNHYHNLLLKAQNSSSSIFTEFEVFGERENKTKSDDFYRFTLLLALFAIYSFPPILLSTILLHEKILNFKILMKLHGLSIIVYWIVNLICYSIILNINVWIGYLLITYMPGEKVLGDATFKTFGLISLYQINIISFIFLSTLFIQTDVAMTILVIIYQIIIGLGFGIFIFTSWIKYNSQLNGSNYNLMRYFLYPPTKFFTTTQLLVARVYDSSLEYDLTLDFLFQILAALIFFVFLLIIEYRRAIIFYLKNCVKKKNELNNDSKNLLLKVININKSFFRPKYFCCCPFIPILKLFKRKNKNLLLKEFKANDNISFEIQHNESLALIGLNGSGKTTLFNILAGKIIPNSGNILFNNLDLEDPSNKTAGKIGYCPQYPAYLSNLSVRKHLNILYGIRGIWSFKEQKKLVINCLKDFNCSNVSNRYIDNLSGGERKRIALSMAHLSSVKEPDIFLFDEAIAALDISSQEMVKNHMSDIVNKSKKSILFSTHYFDEIEMFSKTILLLESGRVSFLGSIQDFYGKYKNMYSLNIRLNEQADGDEIVKSLTSKFNYLKLEYSYKLQKIFTFQNIYDYDIVINSEYNNSIRYSTLIFKAESERLIDKTVNDAAFYIKCIGDILQNEENKIESISFGPFDLEMALAKKCEQNLNE